VASPKRQTRDGLLLSFRPGCQDWPAAPTENDSSCNAVAVADPVAEAAALHMFRRTGN